MAGRSQTVSEQITDRAGTSRDASRVTHSECVYAKIDLSTDASTTVSANPALLFGVYVSTVLSAHTVDIEDGSTGVITLPASLAAGTNLHWPNGIRFETSLIVNPNDSSTGVIIVLYRPL